jgi:cytochrome P450/NADPH-cytochrome P450 reductase
MRACIVSNKSLDHYSAYTASPQGRPFAWQEMQLALASIFQKFDLSLVDPSYNLELKQSLTIKPKDFQVRATLRTSKPRLYSTPSSVLTRTRGYSNPPPAMHINASTTAEQPLYVLYGSNTGTSETFAQRIANGAPAYG